MRGEVSASVPSQSSAAGASIASSGVSYKDTLNLLQTPFAMRANARVREPELQALWQELGLYERLSSDYPGPGFTLHDVPPYD